jgi:2-isopropylmalate synthase
MEALIKEEIHITNFNLKSIGQGRDALVETHIEMTVNGAAVSGRATSQDLLEASAKALLNAVNRFFFNQSQLQKQQTLF